MPSESEDRERAEFKKWAAKKGLDLCLCDTASCGSWKHYQFDATVWAWEAWQDARRDKDRKLERLRKAEELLHRYLPSLSTVIDKMLTYDVRDFLTKTGEIETE